MTAHTKQKPTSREIIRKIAAENGWTRDDIADYANFDRFGAQDAGALEITYDRRGGIISAHVTNPTAHVGVQERFFLDRQNRAGVIEYLTTEGTT